MNKNTSEAASPLRPHVICHMASSVDGKIDGMALRAVMREGEYEATGEQLGGDAWICGRTTMQQHFADAEPFVSAMNTPSGPQPVHVARRAESYAISVDTVGKLRWSDNEIDGDHIICVVSECAPRDYLDMLRERGVSFVVAGAGEVDLVQAVHLLRQHFEIRTLRFHLTKARDNGVTQEELVETITHLAFYSGWPNAMTAIGVAKEVFENK